jgi:hypothetical protein
MRYCKDLVEDAVATPDPHNTLIGKLVKPALEPTLLTVGSMGKG